MDFMRHIIGFITALLFSVLGVVAMPMASTASPQAEFFPYQEAFTADHTSVHFAARAPPTTLANVAVTDDVTVMHGSAIVTHGVEAQWASLNFGADLVAPNRTFTKDNAFETIDQFRSRKGGFDELGDSIPIKGDGQGTVAFVDVGGKPIFGVNSSALVRDVDKNLGRSWRDRLGLGQGEGQIVWHAEGHSLMRAYEKTGGNMPSSVNMFVDRISCANCRTHLPKLVNEMGIDNVNLTFKNGRTGRISGGTFEWVD